MADRQSHDTGSISVTETHDRLRRLRARAHAASRKLEAEQAPQTGPRIWTGSGDEPSRDEVLRDDELALVRHVVRDALPADDLAELRRTSCASYWQEVQRIADATGGAFSAAEIEAIVAEHVARPDLAALRARIAAEPALQPALTDFLHARLMPPDGEGRPRGLTVRRLHVGVTALGLRTVSPRRVGPRTEAALALDYVADNYVRQAEQQVRDRIRQHRAEFL